MKKFKSNSEIRPIEFNREFDAHIYFNDKNLEKVLALREKMIKDFNVHEVFIGDMIPIPLGPHPQSMFEVNFTTAYFSKIVLWLMKEHDNISVLIHRVSGDDFIDHTREALWLGSKVELDFSKF